MDKKKSDSIFSDGDNITVGEYIEKLFLTNEDNSDKDPNKITNEEAINNDTSIFYNVDSGNFFTISADSMSGSNNSQNTFYNCTFPQTTSTTTTYTILQDFLEETPEQKEERLRDQNPVLKEAWDHYQLLLHIIQEDEEFDSNYENRYKGFK